jgi:hypothetical protein
LSLGDVFLTAQLLSLSLAAPVNNPAMKTKIPAVILLSLFAGLTMARGAGWAGNYTDKQYLNGKAVFQLSILEEGERISVDFDAAYNDGHGCAPQGNGPATVADKDTLKFTFTDSSGNAGTGTIKRAGSEVLISIKPKRVADSRCLVFYGDNIRLHPAR